MPRGQLCLAKGRFVYEGDRASCIRSAWLPFVAGFVRSTVVFAACILSLIVHCCLYKSLLPLSAVVTRKNTALKPFTLYITAGQFSIRYRCDLNPSRWRLQWLEQAPKPSGQPRSRYPGRAAQTTTMELQSYCRHAHGGTVQSHISHHPGGRQMVP